MIDVEIIPIFDDNYVYFVEDTETGFSAIVDCGNATPVIEWLEQNGKKPDLIFVTHHHYDHIQGVICLSERYKAKVVGPKADLHRIDGIDQAVEESDLIAFGCDQVRVMETHGHTMGHVSYYFEQADILFCGDTLFAMGCGRLFEGTPADMFASFEKYSALPDDTRVYCGHEYSRANGEFCLSIEPDNKDLQARMAELPDCTMPSTIGKEKKTNVFMRAKSKEQFGAYRLAKDSF